MIKHWIMLVCLLGVSSAVFAGVPVQYQDGNTVLEGYLSVPASSLSRPRPAVLICHAWQGIQAHERQVADRLASQGIVAFVLDIYGKGVRPQTPQEAGKLSGMYKSNRLLLRQRAMAGFSYLKTVHGVNPASIGVIGYCFGGTTAIELGRTGADVKGIVSFHGGLDSPTPSDDARIKAPVVLMCGASDPFVSSADVNTMLNSFSKSHVVWTQINFSDAVHAFTDPAAGDVPSRGAAYDRRADEESWILFWGYLKRWFGNFTMIESSRSAVKTSYTPRPS